MKFKNWLRQVKAILLTDKILDSSDVKEIIASSKKDIRELFHAGISPELAAKVLGEDPFQNEDGEIEDLEDNDCNKNGDTGENGTTYDDIPDYESEPKYDDEDDYLEFPEGEHINNLTSEEEDEDPDDNSQDGGLEELEEDCDDDDDDD
jgi:hypothetical protein